MIQETPKISNLLLKVLLPVVIGMAMVAWLFYDEFSVSSWSNIHFGSHALIGMATALVFVAGRDFGLTWRFHTIASPDLSWRRAFRVDLMCAFTSAITPSVVGGSAFAIFYLNREGVGVGRATTLTLTTLFLDELFFVVFCPIIVLFMPLESLFGGNSSPVLDGIQVVFWLVYAGTVVWTAILFFGIIVSPRGVQRMLVSLFRIKLLRRWLPAIEGTAANMVETSQWVKGCTLGWWTRVFCATVVSWFSRYLIVNALFWAFVPDSSPLLIFCRQFVVWVVLMVSPTPGGSGLSEWIFTQYYGDIIGSGDLAVVMALIWRLITYYLYLVIGVILIPGYFKKKKG